MRGKPLNLVGRTFGRLTVIEKVKVEGKKDSHWKVSCECSNQKVISAKVLIVGDAKSCGCAKDDHKVRTGDIKGLRYIPTSEVNTPTANSYCAMISRCYRTKNHNYDAYGGRGITVCERWLGREGYANFKADMGERPYGKTLDRINVEGRYEPSNCRWATAHEQARNKRTTYSRKAA